jgi:ERCC4-type nuclease
MPKRVYHVELRIDAHEHSIIPIFKVAYPNGHPDIDWSKNLVLGDFQILVDGVTAIAIERKDAGDFRSSVAEPGQRFRKQRSNMILTRKKQPSLLLMYIFEGNVNDLFYNPGTRFTAAHLQQLQVELSTKYGILTHHMNDYSETARFICQIVECYKKNGAPSSVIAAVKPLDVEGLGRKKLAPEPEPEVEEGDVEEFANPRYSPQAFFRIALESIYGMTPIKAQLVMELYHNFPNMCNAYSRLSSDARRFNFLAKLKAPGESRFFGPVLSKRIYACVIGMEEMTFRKTVVKLDTKVEEEVKEQNFVYSDTTVAFRDLVVLTGPGSASAVSIKLATRIDVLESTRGEGQTGESSPGRTTTKICLRPSFAQSAIFAAQGGCP